MPHRLGGLRRLGKGPGLPGFVEQIIPRLQQMAFDSTVIDRLVGGNIVG